MGPDGNYWGHNAIIRLAPFMEHCALPDLPGKEPFGGKILSHDFVEAALLRKAGWAVWMAPELEGTYEEGPPTLIDAAKRDRRWCQGNLQHTWLLFARGLRTMSRVHLTMGIAAYSASLVWLTSLLLGTLLISGAMQALQAFEQYQLLVLGPLLVVIMIAFPNGLAGIWASLEARWRVRRLRREGAPPLGQGAAR